MPVGVTDPVVTVAVKVTICPKIEGLADDVTDVVLAATGTSVNIEIEEAPLFATIISGLLFQYIEIPVPAG